MKQSQVFFDPQSKAKYRFYALLATLRCAEVTKCKNSLASSSSFHSSIFVNLQVFLHSIQALTIHGGVNEECGQCSKHFSTS